MNNTSSSVSIAVFRALMRRCRNERCAVANTLRQLSESLAMNYCRAHTRYASRPTLLQRIRRCVCLIHTPWRTARHCSAMPVHNHCRSAVARMLYVLASCIQFPCPPLLRPTKIFWRDHAGVPLCSLTPMQQLHTTPQHPDVRIRRILHSHRASRMSSRSSQDASCVVFDRFVGVAC